MCYDEGKLLSYLDNEVSADERATMAAHIADCDDCSAAVSRLEADRAFAADALSTLKSVAEVVPLPARPTPPPGRGHQAEWLKYAAVAAVAAVLLGSFAFGPVRSAAADLLRIFRVQNVATVNVTQTDLESIQTALEAGKGHIDLKSLGEAWIDGGEQAAKKVTLAQAQAAVDFPVLLPKDATGTPQIALQPAATYRFKLHVAAINKALESYGSERLLPDSVDGKVFTVQIPAVVTAHYGKQQAQYTKELMAGTQPGDAPVLVGQSRSPQLIVPDGVDPAQLRDVLVNLPFLPSSVRDQLAAMKDWQSTLVIPNVDGTARNITIDGTPAVLVSPQSAARDLRAKMAPLPDSATVIWNQDGVVRAVGGAISEERAKSLAESMMR